MTKHPEELNTGVEIIPSENLVTLSGETQVALQALGWDLVNYDKESWSWFKYDAAGEVIAQAGDATWSADLTAVGYTEQPAPTEAWPTEATSSDEADNSTT